jgi:hypothetical protein
MVPAAMTNQARFSNCFPPLPVRQKKAAPWKAPQYWGCREWDLTTHEECETNELQRSRDTTLALAGSSARLKKFSTQLHRPARGCA